LIPVVTLPHRVQSDAPEDRLVLISGDRLVIETALVIPSSVVEARVDEGVAQVSREPERTISITVSISIAISVAISVTIPVAIPITIAIAVTLPIAIAVPIAIAIAIPVSGRPIAIAVSVPISVTVSITIPADIPSIVAVASPHVAPRITALFGIEGRRLEIGGAADRREADECREDSES